MALAPEHWPGLAGPAHGELQRALAQRVARDCLGGELKALGKLCSNYYSFTFSLEADLPTGSAGFYVKIPKDDMRQGKPAILPISPEDRRLAREEETSLRSLRETWPKADPGVRWVNLRAYVPEYNALVTDRVEAEEAVALFRRLDLQRRLGSRRAAARLRHLLGRLGLALGRFHQAQATPAVFHLIQVRPKLEAYCRDIAGKGGGEWPGRIVKKLRSLGDREWAAARGPTLKGIDIRNVLVDHRDDLHLLDPGKMKVTFGEADLARFALTYRILHWGTVRMLLLREPDPGAERAFLEAYYSAGPVRSTPLLNIFLLKEQLKHWRTALDSLELRPWPPWTKRIARTTYVNAFYSRQVAETVAALPS